MSIIQRGYNWAQNEASPLQLSRLSEFAKGISSPDWNKWFTMCVDAYTAAERFFYVLNPDQYGNRESSTDFWGEHYSNIEVQRFAEGALEYLGEKGIDSPLK